MNIYNFNKKINGLNNLNEGEYANNLLNGIERDIINKTGINLEGNNSYKEIYKEIKF